MSMHLGYLLLGGLLLVIWAVLLWFLATGR